MRGAECGRVDSIRWFGFVPLLSCCAIPPMPAVDQPATACHAENEGLEGEVIVQRLLGQDFEVGYNAMYDRVENLIDAGVLDPTKVTRSGLTNACSIAGIMLTTQVCVGEGRGRWGVGGWMEGWHCASPSPHHHNAHVLSSPAASSAGCDDREEAGPQAGWWYERRRHAQWPHHVSGGGTSHRLRTLAILLLTAPQIRLGPCSAGGIRTLPPVARCRLSTPHYFIRLGLSLAFLLIETLLLDPISIRL